MTAFSVWQSLIWEVNHWLQSHFYTELPKNCVLNIICALAASSHPASHHLYDANFTCGKVMFSQTDVHTSHSLKGLLTDCLFDFPTSVCCIDCFRHGKCLMEQTLDVFKWISLMLGFWVLEVYMFIFYLRNTESQPCIWLSKHILICMLVYDFGIDSWKLSGP